MKKFYNFVADFLCDKILCQTDKMQDSAIYNLKKILINIFLPLFFWLKGHEYIQGN